MAVRKALDKEPWDFNNFTRTLDETKPLPEYSSVSRAHKLREFFAKQGVIRIMGAHDGITAKIVEVNAFDCVWAGSFEVSASHAVCICVDQR